MSKITIKYDPQGITRPDKAYEEKTNKCAIDIILDEVSSPLEYVTASLNGKILKLPIADENGITDLGDEQELTRELTESDILKVMITPKGGALDFVVKVITFPLKLIGKVFSWVYDVPSYSSSTENTASKNKSSLSGQSNTTNLYAAIPDRYGNGVIYPDLISNEAFSVYSENTQTLTQFMCLGVGEYDWDEVYLGETPIGLVPDATVTRYDPVGGVTTIPEYFFTRTVSQVSRSNLDGPGYQRRTISANDNTIYFTYDDVNDIGRIDVDGTNVSPAFDFYFENGDEVELFDAISIIGDDGLLGSGLFDASGIYTVGNVSGRYIEFINTLDTTKDGLTALNGVEAWESGINVDVGDEGLFKIYNNIIYVVSDTAAFPFVTGSQPDSNFEIYEKNWGVFDRNFGTGTASYQSGAAVDVITIQTTSEDLVFQGPFYTATKAKGFLLDFGFYGGLKRTVTVRVDYTVHTAQDGPAIDSGTLEFTYTENTYDQLNFTEEFIYSGNDQNDYYFGVSVARTTAESTAADKPDTVKWDRFSAYAGFNNKQFGYNVSLIKVVIPYSSSALSPSSNKVNITATRKTVSYDINTGSVITAISPTTSFADAILHMYTVTHQRSASELDLYSLYEISNRIGSPLNLFTYYFDDLTQSLEDKMEIICKVARCSFTWDGQAYRFYRDEKKTGIPHIITRTDIAHPDVREYSRAFSPNLPSAYDSVKVEYVYPDRNNEAAYIRLRYDSGGNIVEGLGVNPLNITVPGCRNKDQATNLAHYEIRRLLYQRWSLQDTLMKNGYLLDENDFIQYTDVFRDDIYSGEILNVSGSTIYLSSLVTLESGVNYELWYNDEYGDNYGPVELFAGDGSTLKYVTAVNALDLASVYTRNGEFGSSIQVGSRFSINKITEGRKELFTVSTKQGKDDQHVNIALEQYDERIFDYD